MSKQKTKHTKKATPAKVPSAMVTDGTKHPLPAFKPATPNRLKAPSPPAKGSKEWAESRAQAIVAYVLDHNGQTVAWKDFCKSTALKSKDLGILLSGLLKIGAVIQSDPKAYIYEVRAA